MVDEHEWVLEEGANAGRCEHDPLSEEGRNKPWLKKESPAHSLNQDCLGYTLSEHTSVLYQLQVQNSVNFGSNI